MVTISTAPQAKRNCAEPIPTTLTGAEQAKLRIEADLPLFAAIIECDDWHVASTPAWPKSKSLADVEVIAAKYVKRLRRFRDLFPGPEFLADRLASCRPGHRCMSGACVQCGRALQRWSVAEITRIVQERRDAP